MSSQHRTGLWARSPQCITWVLAALTATALAVPPPHVVMIIADDLGWADVGFSHASDVRTPHIDALLSRGVRLSHYYSLPVCTPSRGALQTGRYPLVYGLQTYVIPAGTDYGLNVNETTLPSLLRDRAGYATHAIGKWHLGMASWQQTPTFRGYDSFHGFYSGGQDYYTHIEEGGFDLHVDSSPRCGPSCSVVDWANSGTYSTTLYTATAVDVIARHNVSKPLFMYLAYQAVHSPDQVPQHYIDPYNATIPDAKRRTFAGMLSALDEGVGNVTRALDAAGLTNSTLILFIADNGGPIACTDGPCGDATGSSNWPLRGGKHTLWEGGVRVTAVASGPMVHGPHGTNETGLMHHVDWLPTLLEAAGITDYTPAPGFELHGVSQWQTLTRGSRSPRADVLTNIDPAQPVTGTSIAPGSGNAAIVTAEGWKLHLGLTGPPNSWSPPNASRVTADLGGTGDIGPHIVQPATMEINCVPTTFVAGVCLPGGDIAPAVAADTPTACCAACAGVAGCTAWTYRAAERRCYIKGPSWVPVKPATNATCTSSASSRGPGPVWPLGNMTAQLYNLTVDPWERNDVAALYPDIVANLTARLTAWGMRAAVPYFSTAEVNPASNPAHHNGSWVPWLA